MPYHQYQVENKPYDFNEERKGRGVHGNQKISKKQMHGQQE